MTDLTPHAGAAPARAGTYHHELSREQVELVKRTVAQGTNDDELALFLETARRRGLDPFSGQIHAIMRWDGRANREVMRIQTGIDGYRSIANRTGLVDYVDGPEWTADGATWVPVWLEDTPPRAARFTVKRKDRSRPETRTATWREYAQTNRQGELTRAWRELSATMLGKVAEAAALRAAFPDELGGIYTADEMDQADNPAPADDQLGDGETEAGPRVDHADERRDLFVRWQAAWKALDDETRGTVWQEIRGRLRGDGTMGDAFAATPLHVLVEVVDRVEAAAGDDGDELPDDGPGDEPPGDDGPPPADAPDGEQVDEVEAERLATIEERRAQAAAALADEDPAPADDDPAPSDQVEEPEAGDADAGLDELLEVYRHATVVEVRQFVIEGAVTITADGAPRELTITDTDLQTRVALVDALEERLAQLPDGLGRRRRTVDAVLDQHRTAREDAAGSSEAPGAGEGTGEGGNGEQAPTGDAESPAWAERLRVAYRDALSASPDGMPTEEHRRRWQLAQRWLAARVEIGREVELGRSGNAGQIAEVVDADLRKRVGNLPGGWLYVDLEQAEACAAHAERQRSAVVPF